ncbi:hypothetical protein [Scytonema sp. UIC 10036]|uniref:hypothetical protein n=1 Tax=Scytonema sp. UIC 10036 TaxID=2304196 RepID=UPI0012DA9AE0|nr:hypothetical protein [Scytonema sp. UIC 10036]
MTVYFLYSLFSRRTPDSEAIIYPSMFTEDGQPIEENHRIIVDAIRLKPLP